MPGNISAIRPHARQVIFIMGCRFCGQTTQAAEKRFCNAKQRKHLQNAAASKIKPIRQANNHDATKQNQQMQRQNRINPARHGQPKAVTTVS